MILLLMVAAGAGLLVFAAVVPLIGLWRALCLVLLAALALAPYPLTTTRLPQVHYGITDGIFIPMTYSIALAAIVVAALRDRAVRLSLVFAAGFLVYVSILTVMLWGNTAAQWSGNVHLITALLAVGVGGAIGRSMLTDRKLRLLWVSTALGILLMQLLLGVAQLAGIPVSLFTNEVNHFIPELRAIGSFNHPSVIGKTVLVLLIMVLPFTRDSSKWIARIAWAVILVGIVATTLTQARSNIAAVLVAVVLWVLFDNRRSIKGRLIAAALAAVAAVPFALLVIPRFLSDPGGGDRAELLGTGLKQIASAPWFGIGPNSYSAVVGVGDSLAAEGFPVHNAALLAVAELGAIGAMMVFVPVAWQYVSAVRSWPKTGFAHGAAVATFVTLPGLALVTMTGWGMLSEGSLVLWYLAIGFSIGVMNQTVKPTVLAASSMADPLSLFSKARCDSRSAGRRTK
ncbi:hypothetical protein GCM10022381_42000 [Leifsonia kafniensis]|uniref:O-antigen ligase-related domain-containing protein n=1 Tax=Leifsonia kafniensis TaxID=475957 RepID=A0ABP7L731_9MICO